MRTFRGRGSLEYVQERTREQGVGDPKINEINRTHFLNGPQTFKISLSDCLQNSMSALTSVS